MYLRKIITKKTAVKKLFLCCHPEIHLEKSRIRNPVILIRGSGSVSKRHWSATLTRWSTRMGSQQTGSWIRYPLKAISVPDLWHFETDPDPWIRTLDSGFRDANKEWAFFTKFFLFITVLTVGRFKTVLKDNKSLRSHWTVATKVILKLFGVDGMMRILEAQKLTDPEHTEGNIQEMLPPCLVSCA